MWPGQDPGTSDTELACVQPSETSFGWNLEDKHRMHDAPLKFQGFDPEVELQTGLFTLVIGVN